MLLCLILNVIEALPAADCDPSSNDGEHQSISRRDAQISVAVVSAKEACN